MPADKVTPEIAAVRGYPTGADFVPIDSRPGGNPDGGLRVSSEIARTPALDADVVALETVTPMACGCQQHRICSTGQCPQGVTTQDRALRTQMKNKVGADRLANFLYVIITRLEDFARLTGHTDIHELSRDDPVTTSSTVAACTDLRHILVQTRIADRFVEIRTGLDEGPS